MFEQRSQKVLLALALVLLGALVLDQLAVSPLWKYLSAAETRIADLRAEIAEGERLRPSAQRDRERADAVERRLRVASEQGLNEFRRYLEAMLDPSLEVTSSAQVSAVDMPGAPGLKRIVYDLRLTGSQDSLRTALDNLDASVELLRVEKLELSNSSPDDPGLDVNMLVSTVSSVTARPGSARPPLLAPAGRKLSPLAKNIFYPAGRLPSGAADGGIARRTPPAGEFVLVGTVTSSRRREALLEFPASGQVRWVGIGERVGEMTVADVRAEEVVFQLGGQRRSLAVGRGREDLLAGRRVFGGGFELVGVCHGEDQRFAMIQLDDGGKVRRVHVKDRLGSGVIVEIVGDGIVLRIGSDHHTVWVGGRHGGRAGM